ncbi:MAG: aminoacyl-tRNA hydrolase [Deltaproteobacteria bacterium]|nr:aminoacyl-tRNA hydrolase [Deltaproteobacteria bacterium]
MKLVVGLGNPGERYAETRHNIGFMTVLRLARDWNIPLKRKSYQGIFGVGRVDGEEAAFLLPQTFMNLSGASVGAAVAGLCLVAADLIVIHDDIDLPFGFLRIRPGGGHGGHNGLRHISRVLGSGEFARVRLGIGRPAEGEDVADYVLRGFSSSERKHLDFILETAARATAALVCRGIDKAMNEFSNCDMLKLI